uniref:Cyclin N-terminal domain-containing protein n=1 Tax=Hydatigena taeniaeformis TaxID=6205 RepID=A0A0R3WXA6_HYDTA
LRFMHNAFFTLSAEAFCKAVNLIDRFIVKVKVKPKYMACVAAAAYYVAAKLVESTPQLNMCTLLKRRARYDLPLSPSLGPLGMTIWYTRFPSRSQGSSTLNYYNAV